MCDINDGIFGEIDVFEILKLLEERWEDIEGFFLRWIRKYGEIKTGELVAGVVEYELEVVKVFVDEFVKVNFLFAFFLFLSFFLHFGFKLYNSNEITKSADRLIIKLNLYPLQQ